MGIAKNTKGADFNKFDRVTIAGFAFNDISDVTFNFRCSQMSFCLLLDGYGTVEYSFNGNTVHGDLKAGMPSEAIFFDNRVVNGIWFRALTPDAIGAVIRVEGWGVV
jgi:hypothetical protein